MKPSEDHRSVVFWLIVTMVAGFLFIAPFYHGLFNGNNVAISGDGITFAAPLNVAFLFAAFLLLVLCVRFLSLKRDVSINWLSISVVWLVPLSFAIAYFAQPASKQLAVQSIYLHFFYAVCFISAVYLASSNIGRFMLRGSILYSGYMLVIYGLLNWFGFATYPDAVLDGRLSNVFQYPNSYSAYLLMIGLITIYQLSKSKKVISAFAYGSFLVPVIVSFVLTLSRGGLVIIPLILIIYMLLIDWKKQVRSLLYLLIGVTTSSLIIVELIEERAQLVNSGANAIGGAILLLGVSIGVGLFVACSTALEGRLYKSSTSFSRTHTRLYIPTGILIISVGLYFLLFRTTLFLEYLPPNLRRIVTLDITQSGLMDRGTFFNDALALFQTRPLFGNGGGAWSARFLEFQSYPYTSRQAHSFLFQYLTEVGIFGVLILLAIIVGALLLFIKRYVYEIKKQNELDISYIIIVVVILSHSSIDFDLSYGYLGALVFLGLGALMGQSGEELKGVPLKYPKPLVMGQIVVLLILSVVIIVASSVRVQADRYFMEAKKEIETTGQIGLGLDKAIELQPSNAEFRLYKSYIYLQLFAQSKDEAILNEGVNILKTLETDEPHNQQIMDMLYSYNVESGNYLEALKIAEKAVEKHPWLIMNYERAIQLYYVLGAQDASPSEYWVEGINVYEAALRRQQQLGENVWVSNGTFEITSEMKLYAGQTLFYMRQFERATDVLGPAVVQQFDQEFNRKLARYYLAALKMQGQTDVVLEGALFNQAPEEKDIVEQLIEEVQ